MSELAINGGPKAKPTPYAHPNRYGEDEIRLLTEAIADGALMCTSGSKVREFEEGVCEAFGCAHCVMTTSGTASIHAALAAVGVGEGDEVITNPMVDIGTCSAILAQHAIPLFADIDLETATICPKSAESLVTEKTKAILVVHQAGNIADLAGFLELSERHGVPLVEDCAQCHGGRWQGRTAGTIGKVGAFSMNESKHMSTGDGGFVITDDEEVARLARLFTDKTYLRDGTVRGAQPIPFVGLNYRPNCLHGAVGLAQLGKLDANVSRRREIVDRYFAELADLPEFSLPKVHDGAEPAWWPLPSRYTGGNPTRQELGAALGAEGLSIGGAISPAHNILHTELIQQKRFYPLTDRVPHFWRETEYDPDSCPNVNTFQQQVMRLPVDQRYTDEDISQTIEGMRKVWRHFFG